MRTVFLVAPLPAVVRWKRVLLPTSPCLGRDLDGRASRVEIQTMAVARHSTSQSYHLNLVLPTIILVGEDAVKPD